MSAALCALYEIIKQDPLPYKNLVPSFISILKQVTCCLSTLSAHMKWIHTCSCKLIKYCDYLEHSSRVAMCRLQSIAFQRHMTITDHLHPSYRQADNTLPAYSSALWHVVRCRTCYAQIKR